MCSMSYNLSSHMQYLLTIMLYIYTMYVYVGGCISKVKHFTMELVMCNGHCSCKATVSYMCRLTTLGKVAMAS